MTKILAMKKNDFLKRIQKYVSQKKEKPIKLYTTPKTLVAIKIKFAFLKVDEITLQPHELSFYRDASGKQTRPGQTRLGKGKEKATDADSGKTYYFRFCEPLLRELTVRKIYAGKSAEEKIENLSAWLNTVKDGKIIFEIVFGQGEKKSSVTAEDYVSGSQSFVESFESGSADYLLKSKREERSKKEEGNASRDPFEQDRKELDGQGAVIDGLEEEVKAYKKLAEKNAQKIRERNLTIESLRGNEYESGRKINLLEQTISDRKETLKSIKENIEVLGQTVKDLESENAQLNSMAVAQKDEAKAHKKGKVSDRIITMASEGSVMLISLYIAKASQDGKVKIIQDGKIRIIGNVITNVSSSGSASISGNGVSMGSGGGTRLSGTGMISVSSGNMYPDLGSKADKSRIEALEQSFKDLESGRIRLNSKDPGKTTPAQKNEVKAYKKGKVSDRVINITSDGKIINIISYNVKATQDGKTIMSQDIEIKIIGSVIKSITSLGSSTISGDGVSMGSGGEIRLSGTGMINLS